MCGLVTKCPFGSLPQNAFWIYCPQRYAIFIKISAFALDYMFKPSLDWTNNVSLLCHSKGTQNHKLWEFNFSNFFIWVVSPCLWVCKIQNWTKNLSRDTWSLYSLCICFWKDIYNMTLLIIRTKRVVSF